MSISCQSKRWSSTGDAATREGLLDQPQVAASMMHEELPECVPGAAHGEAHCVEAYTLLGSAGEAAGSSADLEPASAQGQVQAQAEAGGLAQFVGDVQQMAQAWLGGASHAAMQDSDSDTEMSEMSESDSDEEEVFDEEGSPRGTKGRDM